MVGKLVNGTGLSDDRRVSEQVKTSVSRKFLKSKQKTNQSQLNERRG